MISRFIQVVKILFPIYPNVESFCFQLKENRFRIRQENRVCGMKNDATSGVGALLRIKRFVLIYNAENNDESSI